MIYIHALLLRQPWKGSKFHTSSGLPMLTNGDVLVYLRMDRGVLDGLSIYGMGTLN